MAASGLMHKTPTTPALPPSGCRARSHWGCTSGWGHQGVAPSWASPSALQHKGLQAEWAVSPGPTMVGGFSTTWRQAQRGLGPNLGRTRHGPWAPGP